MKVKNNVIINGIGQDKFLVTGLWFLPVANCLLPICSKRFFTAQLLHKINDR